MTRYLLAPDKFKGSLTAAEVCEALAEGILAADPAATITAIPLADGGDGSVAAALAAGFSPVRVPAAGPAGEPIETTVAVKPPVAVVEVADIIGFARLVGPPDTATHTSLGVGMAIRQTLSIPGVQRIIVALGGSTTTDAGIGMLEALGARLRTWSGRPAPLGGLGLTPIVGVDLSAVHRRMGPRELVGLADVTNPLLGPAGTARVFAPQKGADPATVERLGSALEHICQVFADDDPATRALADRPGAGAAGGLGYAVLLARGRLESGAAWFCDALGVAQAIEEADLVITGEGSLDEQTAHGKLPSVVASMTTAARRPVEAVVGRTTLPDSAIRDLGFRRVWALTQWMAEPRPPQDAAAGERSAYEEASTPQGATAGERSADADPATDPQLSRRLLRGIGKQLARNVRG